MDPLDALAHVETLYRQLLDLTLRQETFLVEGRLEELSACVTAKIEVLARTEELMADVARVTDRGEAHFREGVDRLAVLLQEVVASEERARHLMPAAPPVASQPPNRVLAAYRKA